MNTKKLSLLFFSLLSVWGTWATPTATYSITAAYSVIQNSSNNVWCKNQRAITLTFSSTQDVASAFSLFYELTPASGSYQSPVQGTVKVPALSSNKPLNKSYDFTSAIPVSNFTDNKDYKITFYYINPSNINSNSDLSSVNETPSEKTKLSECTIKYVHEPQSITVKVADGATIGTFSSALHVDFSDTNKKDVIGAYTVNYDPTTPDKVTLNRHKKVLPANNGVILYAPTSTKSQSFNVVTTTSETVDASNKMVAVPAGANVDASLEENHNYVVSGTVFSALATTTIIEGGKAYLSITRSPNQNAKEFSIFYTPTGIEEIQEEKTVLGKGQIYTIQGQKAGYLHPGQIYICNGKKVLVK